MALRLITPKISSINAAVKTTVRHKTDIAQAVKEKLAKGEPPQKNYPHLKQGRAAFYSYKLTKELFVFMIDMQGISPKELKLWAENDQKVMFEGEENKKHKFERMEHSTRLYRGSFGLDPNAFDTSRVKGEILDGVLTVEVPRRVPLPDGQEKRMLRVGEWIELHYAFTKLRFDSREGDVLEASLHDL